MQERVELLTSEVKRKINELDVPRTWMNKSPKLGMKAEVNPLQMLTYS